MWFNITSIVGFILSALSTIYLCKSKKGYQILRYLALTLLLLKIGEYIYMNISNGFTYPIEISAITYFMFSIIVLLKIEKLYHVAAFFGIISGIGFFLYYSALGFITAFYFEMGRHIIAIIAHGLLFIGGTYLLLSNDFRKTNKMDLLLTMVLILAHASIFYTDAIKGTTFVYFLIRPEFLKISSIDSVNHFIKIIYYLTAFLIFGFTIKKFYYINEQTITNKKIITNK